MNTHLIAIFFELRTVRIYQRWPVWTASGNFVIKFPFVYAFNVRSANGWFKLVVNNWPDGLSISQREILFTSTMHDGRPACAGREFYPLWGGGPRGPSAREEKCSLMQIRWWLILSIFSKHFWAVAQLFLINLGERLNLSSQNRFRATLYCGRTPLLKC